jgi:hypothetical protein
MKCKFKLGDSVQDTISGFEGKIVAITFWIANCIRITVAATKLHEGKPIDNQCFDEPILELIHEAKEKKAKAFTGGDQKMQARTGF